MLTADAADINAPAVHLLHLHFQALHAIIDAAHDLL